MVIQQTTRSTCNAIMLRHKLNDNVADRLKYKNYGKMGDEEKRGDGREIIMAVPCD